MYVLDHYIESRVKSIFKIITIIITKLKKKNNKFI